MTTILVTGSEGFTGRYVTRLLRKEGYDVVGLVHHSPQVGEIACDLTAGEQVRRVLRETRPHGVIHLAGLSFVGHSSPGEFYTINVLGTLNILEGLQAENIRPEKVIIASSANVYGNPGRVVIDEDTPVRPVNHYAASKLAMEYLVQTWFDRLPILVTRPFNYTGPGQGIHFLVPKIVDHFRRQAECITLGNLDVGRDFSDVRDIARAYLELFRCDAQEEIVNLCSGRVYYLREILDMMREIAGYAIRVEQDPSLMRDNEIAVLQGSNRKLTALTGFRPRYDLSATLRDMYQHRIAE